MFQLGHFHLQLTFEGAGALGKDVKNQPGAIEYPTTDQSFEIAFLRGREGAVEQDHLSLTVRHQRLEFFRFARTEEVLGVGTIAARRHRRDAIHPRRSSKLGEFFDITARRWRRQRNINEDGAFAASWTVKQGKPR